MASKTAVAAGVDRRPSGLVATTLHPERAGVQQALMEQLLDRGVDPNAQVDGHPAVNMAATMGRADTVRLLIARGAALETKNPCGGTSLGSALWGALNRSGNGDYLGVIAALLAAGARVDPAAVDWWRNEASAVPLYRPTVGVAFKQFEYRRS